MGENSIFFKGQTRQLQGLKEIIKVGSGSFVCKGPFVPQMVISPWHLGSHTPHLHYLPSRQQCVSRKERLSRAASVDLWV